MNRLILLTVLLSSVLLGSFFVSAGGLGNAGAGRCMNSLEVFGFGNNNALLGKVCQVINDQYCDDNRPTSICTPPSTTCTQFVGGACVYSCTPGGTWNDGGVCTSGLCNANGLSCA